MPEQGGGGAAGRGARVDPATGRRWNLNGRRGYAVTLALLALSGAALLLLAGRTWLTVTVTGGLPRPPVSLSGAVVAAGAGAAGAVLLAGAVAVVATRGWVRTAVGVLLVVAGVGASVVAAGVLVNPVAAAGSAGSTAMSGGAPGGVVVMAETLPAALAVAAGIAGAAAGVVVVVAGRRWPAMSARYERHAAPVPGATGSGASIPGATAAGGAAPAVAAGPVAGAAAWDALDRGEDPTVG